MSTVETFVIVVGLGVLGVIGLFALDYARRHRLPSVLVSMLKRCVPSMPEWLRPWFAWRFSLTRLVVAVLFLGVFFGLNMRKIGPIVVDSPSFNLPTCYRGWPLPFIALCDRRASELLGGLMGRYIGPEPESRKAVREEYGKLHSAASSYRIPLTHRTYCVLGRWPLQEGPHGGRYLILYSIIDGLFGLAVLVLILFLQIPRREPLTETP